MKKPPPHEYKVRYTFKVPEVGSFKKEDALPDTGLTDCLFLGSVLYPADGSYSQQFWTFDGRNEGKPWHDGDLFKFWILIAKRLSESPELSPLFRDFSTDVFNTYRNFMLSVHAAEEAAKEKDDDPAT